MGNFSVQAREQDGIVILELSGDLDIDGVPKVKKAFEGYFGKGLIRVVLDLSGMKYTSSAGMGVFMGIARQVKEKGGDVKMAGINDRVGRIFSLIGITRIFSIYTTVEDALGSF